MSSVQGALRTGHSCCCGRVSDAVRGTGGLVRDARRDPSSNDDVAGLEALDYWTHLVIVLEGKLTLGYLCRMNTCLFVSDVSLNPLGLL